ncbi:9053_t:CDS:1, partial [Paraglomus occultum]
LLPTKSHEARFGPNPDSAWTWPGTEPKTGPNALQSSDLVLDSGPTANHVTFTILELEMPVGPSDQSTGPV